MNLELSPDQQALAESVRDFVDSECPVTLVRRVVEGVEGADKETAELWAQVTSLDWPALTVPEPDGGIGLGQVELAVVAEQLGRALAPIPFLATASQFVSAVRHAGTPEQRARFLGAVAAGELVGTLAVAEGSGSFALDEVGTAATPAGDGAWVLSGEKTAVLDAERADELAVVARVDGGGFGVFVVPRGDVAVEPFHSLDASRSLATVTLRDVVVPADRALGDPGTPAAEAAVARALGEATVALTAEMVGTSQAIFDIVHAYVLEREQFGVKIGSFQSMKHKLANMFVALESARATAYFAAAALDEDDERRELAVSMAKSAAGDCAKLLTQEGIQCLGGIGYTWEHDMHLYVKRQKAQAALFGTASAHRAAVAAHLGL
jgi:alkylation response protein AidB-like acyl-CoA dehydrogenase